MYVLSLNYIFVNYYKQFELTEELKKEHKDVLSKMNEIVSKADLVKLQMTTLHSSQPPLDQKGFTNSPLEPITPIKKAPSLRVSKAVMLIA